MKNRILTTLIATAILGSFVQTAVAQSDSSSTSAERPMRAPRHWQKGEVPFFLKDKLTEEQQTQFKAADSFEAQIALLRAWNIEMPRPPHGGDRHGPPPPPPSDVEEAPTGAQ